MPETFVIISLPKPSDMSSVGGVSSDMSSVSRVVSDLSGVVRVASDMSSVGRVRVAALSLL